MQYTSTSIEEVIGRIIRNTRLTDSSYIRSMEEWIPEAMGYMKTKVILTNCWKKLTIEDNRAPLPCGLRAIQAVEAGGQRLRHSETLNRGGNPSGRYLVLTGDSVFSTSFVVREGSEDGGVIHETELTQIGKRPFCGDSYFTEMGWLNTSFSKGYVYLYYRRMPVDEKGFPMIPDNEHYKEAVYWYNRARMIGTGYKDPVFSYEQCEAKWLDHSAKAISQIRYPSVDQMQSRVDMANRLIFPENWWSNFNTL